ncbi:uncharacterized protein T551_01009 [Pneumocystis jirovecii RU7]|uniref:Acid phosphatase n=1 Tax=Pneumocystis jirovecii (strain RU7) TaxID=1408657 RepID=A0A0W4ZTU7_PNEJ7|nr:uncharacterized protein T551_01009 [Pneumocystis jirovecii RU7]KTW31748.1 hypothetical protein T551_01009 [Pneumocystis jirovecii RU7]
MTSLPPQMGYKDSDISKLYPPELSLHSVQIVFRHGERTPIFSGLKIFGFPIKWNVCHSVDRFFSAVKISDSKTLSNQNWDYLKYKRKIETMDKDGSFKRIEDDGACMTGQLTDIGRESTLNLGKRLRKLYVHQLSFLPEFISKSSEIYIRTSDISRALESAQQVFSGLYPPTFRKSTFEAEFCVRELFNENIFPNDDRCKRLRTLLNQFSEFASKTWDPILASRTSKKLSKYIDGKISMKGPVNVFELYDIICTAIGNGIKIPDELYDEELRKDLELASISEWFDGYRDNLEIRKLGIGLFLGELRDNFVESKKDMNDKRRKISLYGAHDTTLGSILQSLDCFDRRWPPYASHIAFELFKKAPKSYFRSFFQNDEWYVRLRYNDIPMIIPECKKKGKHLDGNESFCTFEAFQNIISKMVPKDWNKECSLES